MHKLVIATVGTSITSGTELTRIFYRQETMQMPYNAALPPEWEQILQTKLSKALLPGQTPSISPHCCAELNTINDINPERGDVFYLLANDNAAGCFCAAKIKKLLYTHFDLSESDIYIERIEELQVINGNKLRTGGLSNLCATVSQIIKTHQYNYHIYINPTGGFKGVLPFLTVLGMLHSCRIIYKFENSEQLIDLPSLPITIDTALFMRAAKAIQFAKEQEFFTKESFLNQIQDYEYYEEELFSSLIQKYDDNYYILSPLAECLSVQTEDYTPIKVSTQIQKILLKLSENKRQIATAILNKSGDKQWRASHFHRVLETDIMVLKPGATTERLCGFEQDNTFYAAYYYDNHDDYDRELSKINVERAKKLQYTEWIPQSPEPRVKYLWERITQLEEELAQAKAALNQKNAVAVDLSRRRQ